MKILLALSLIVNVILGVLYFKATAEPPIERIIMEERPVKTVREEVIVSAPVKKIKVKTKAKGDSLPMVGLEGEYMPQEYQEALEDIEKDKHEFFTDKLGLSEEILQKEVKLRNEFAMASTKLFTQSNMGQLSVADRRKLLDMEEELNQKVINLYGKENWQKFENFKNKYNQRIIKSIKERNAPGVLMSP